jgi:DNA repair photolyase
MKDVISCSRRTDIPALYYSWLQERLADKKVTLVNPYSNQPYDVDLSPENIHSIVLWSKNYANVLNDPGMLKDYNLYFQFTINAYPRELEPKTPSIYDIMSQLKLLCVRYNPKQINWRFDPVLFSQYSSWDERLKVFNILAEEASANGVSRCTFSFISIYGKVRESLDAKGIKCEEIPDDKKVEFTKEMVKIATPLNIKLYSCCEVVLEQVEGVNKSHCIDGEILQELFGDKATKAKDQGQRLTCGCTKSKDIGSYTQRCSHRCVYCYANPSSYTTGEK